MSGLLDDLLNLNPVWLLSVAGLLVFAEDAIFLGRFTAFVRAMMPALAGAAQMPYRKFLAWNAVGGIVWGTAFVLLGYAFSDTYKAVEHKAGHWVAVVLAVVVVAAVITWKIRSEREPKPENGENPAA